MKLPPGFTEADIKHLLAEYYGILPAGLRYMPTDWTPYNYGYAVTTREGEQYFCKFYGASPDPYPARSRHFFIPLAYKLQHQGILPHVPYPLKTKGGTLWVDVPDYMVVLQLFIVGQDVGFDGFPDDVLQQLATQVGLLHRAVERLTFEHPFHESYDILFGPALDVILQHKNEWMLSENEPLRKMASILNAYADTIQHTLDFVRQMPSTPAFSKTKVICHTDLHGGNMMLDADHQLYILDWENALIAPPEHDLFFFVGEPWFWDSFWPHYTEAYGSIPHLEPEVFRYYFYRRALEDVTDYAERIAAGEGDVRRDADDLEGMEAILKGLPTADITVQQIATRLSTMEIISCD